MATENYDLQLDLYALGAENSLEQVPVARHTVHFLGDGQVESTEWSRQRADDARSRLEELLRNISAGDFPPRTVYCSRCQEYKSICPHSRATRKRRSR